MENPSEKAATNEESGIAYHYHICWSGSAFDWEAFCSEQEAENSAEKLVRPGETYMIERFSKDCPQCAAYLARLAERMKRRQDSENRNGNS